MNTSHINEQHGRGHHAGKGDESAMSQQMDQRPQQADVESTPQDAPFENHGSASDDYKDASTVISTSTPTNPTGKGKEPETRRGFLGKLKRLEDKLIGTEEERARQRVDMEKEKEEDRKRQEVAYQKQLKKQQDFYAERQAKQRQGRRPEYPEGPEELNVFLKWA